MDVAEALGNNATQAMGFQLFAPVADNVSLGLPGSSGKHFVGNRAPRAVFFAAETLLKSIQPGCLINYSCIHTVKR